MEKVSFGEVVALLGVTRTTIYDYIGRGYLTPLKSELNGRVYFNKKQVLKLKAAI